MDRVLTDRLANLQSQIDALTGVLSSLPPPDSIETRLKIMEQLITEMSQARLQSPIPPGIQPSQGVFGIGTPVEMGLPAPLMAQPTAAPREEPGFTLDPWHSASFELSQRRLREERAQQTAAQASEPSRHLHAEAQALGHSQNSPPIHTHPDAPRVNSEYRPEYAQAPRQVPQVPETFRQY